MAPGNRARSQTGRTIMKIGSILFHRLVQIQGLSRIGPGGIAGQPLAQKHGMLPLLLSQHVG